MSSRFRAGLINNHIATHLGDHEKGQLNIITPEIRVEEHIGLLENPLHKFTNPSKKPMGDVSMKPYAIDKYEDPDHGTYPV